MASAFSKWRSEHRVEYLKFVRVVAQMGTVLLVFYGGTVLLSAVTPTSLMIGLVVFGLPLLCWKFCR